MTHSNAPKDIRFGWARPGHEAIRQAAFQKTALDPAFRQFLAYQQEQIRRADDEQDTLHSGPGHFINLEDPQNQSAPPASWNVVNQWFNPARKTVLEQFCRQNPGYLPQAGYGHNVLNSALQAYGQLIQGIRHLRATGWAYPPAGEQVNRAVGAMSHYVADLFMPLHTTRFHTWQMPDQSGRDAHTHIEQELFNARDYQAIAEAGKNQPGLGLPLNPGNLAGFLVGQVQQTHLKIFDIVALQRQMAGLPRHPAWQATWVSASDQLKQTLAEQIFKAQTTLSLMLQSAWNEAQR